MSAPHDALFRFTFGDPQHAGPLLRALLPAPLAAAIDWPSLAPAADAEVDGEQHEQRCDRLFTAQLAGRPAFLYLLLEHKARPDRWTALQVLSYAVGLWRRLHREQPRLRRLPPVLPIVVHCGRRRWRASTDLHSLLDLASLPPPLRDLIAARQPQFTFAPHDFAAHGQAAVRAMMLSLQGLWTIAALQFLAPVGDDDDAVIAAIADWADVARSILVAPSGQEVVDAVTSYILRVTKLDRHRLRIVIDEQLGAPAMKKFVSTYDQMKLEGKAEGRVEGRAEGQAQLLLRQLQKRFGPLPADTRPRVLAASLDDLDRWAEAVLDAPTLAAVFAAR